MKEREKNLKDAEIKVQIAEENLLNLNRLENKAEQTLNQILNTILIKEKEYEKYNAMISEVTFCVFFKFKLLNLFYFRYYLIQI